MAGRDFFFQLSLWLRLRTWSTRSRAGSPTGAPSRPSRTGSLSSMPSARSTRWSSSTSSARSCTPATARSRPSTSRTGSRSSRCSGSRSSGSTSAGTTRSSRVRNWIFATNLLALVGYVLMPTAPPRMFPEHGFVDTLAPSSAVNHGSGLIEFASNPYAAMPSVHAADALIIGFAMATLVKSRWAAIALDALADVGLVLGHGDRQPLLARHRGRGRRRLVGATIVVLGAGGPALRDAGALPLRPAALVASRAVSRPEAEPPEVHYQDEARRLASRSIAGLERTSVTPDALTVGRRQPLHRRRRASSTSSTVTQLALLLVGAAHLRDRQRARHPRRRARPAQRQGHAVRRLPRLDRRPGGRGLHARRRSGSCSCATATSGASRCLRRHRRLVPRQLHARARRGARAQGRRRHRKPRRAGHRDLRRARLAPFDELSCRSPSRSSPRRPGSRSLQRVLSVRQQLASAD